MNREIARILRLVRAALLFLNRTVERVLRRIQEAQDHVSGSVRGSLPKPSSWNRLLVMRVVAKGIDMILVMLLAYWIWPPFGPFLGFFYSLFADGLHGMGLRGQSFGKKLLGLQVQRKGDSQPGGWRDSVLRNLPAGIATFFAIIPLLGWVIFILVGIPLAVLEVFLMMRMEGQVRLGDIMANTQVVRAR